jgi:FtsP/CotA-like multicopper oxidase with cupredoxin domain
MSLSNKEYYNTFNNYIPTDLTITEEQRYRVKINRYHNTQPAGNLWYHDHAMHNTNYNVRAGLAGNYIIYDN